MADWGRGDFVEFDGILAVVIGVDGDPWVPEEHVALWFGELQGERKSRGGAGSLRPVVLVVPAEYCEPALAPDIRHWDRVDAISHSVAKDRHCCTFP